MSRISAIAFLLLIIGVILPVSAISPDDWKKVSPGNFTSLTKNQVDSVMDPLFTNGTYVGAVVILVDQNGSAIYPYGIADRKSTIRPDQKTLFGTGSISKTFTGLLLADAQIRGTLDLKAPISQYVPPGVQIPSYENKEITLEDIATHTSGLPGVPDKFTDVNSGMSPADQIEQSFRYYETMSPEEAYAYVSNYTLTKEPGTTWEYSNLGTSIAGDIAARSAGTSYADLLKNRILIPLGMNLTTTQLSGEDLVHVATGYRGYSSPLDEAALVRFNDFWAATGGIFSNGEDMSTYLAAQAGIVDTPFSSALHLSHQPRNVRSDGPPQIREGLFWDILETSDNTRVYLKAGETNGYQSDIGMIPDEKVGVIILTNTAYLTGPHVESQVIELLQMMHGRPFA
jgi:CubicO group peptidase (beta-lactamase class C family)